MKSIGEFMTALQGYYGAFKNSVVADDIATEIRYVKPTDLDALLLQIKRTLPATFTPDLKTVSDAVKLLKLDTLSDPNREEKCLVCGTISYSSGVCPHCKYDGGVRDGTPEEYRAWWNEWKEGHVPRFDWSTINIKSVK